jgi:AsmA protein
MIPGGAGGAAGLGSIGGLASGVLKNGIPVAIGGTTSSPTFTPNMRGLVGGVGASAGQGLLKGKSNQNGTQANPLGNALGGLLNRH